MIARTGVARQERLIFWQAVEEGSRERRQTKVIVSRPLASATPCPTPVLLDVSVV
jgi:hypothetical protein